MIVCIISLCNTYVWIKRYIEKKKYIQKSAKIIKYKKKHLWKKGSKEVRGGNTCGRKKYLQKKIRKVICAKGRMFERKYRSKCL